MRIAATSDLHGHLPDPGLIPPCDVLVLAGDICPADNHSITRQQRWLVGEFAGWVARVEEVLGCKVVWIAGNHDLALEHATPEFQAKLPGIYLRDSAVEIGGVSFFGSPWSPIVGNWAFSLPESAPRATERREDPGDLERAYARIPDRVDVVIVHGPPYRVGDAHTFTDNRPGRARRFYRHLGSRALRRRLEEVNPHLCLFGHIHEGFGYSRRLREGAPESVWANVARLNELYRPANPVMLFELDPKSGEVARRRDEEVPVADCEQSLAAHAPSESGLRYAAHPSSERAEG